jgi:hypothetical protein
MAAESIDNAWARLAGQGLDLARASFTIGWELAHIAYMVSGASATGLTTATDSATFQLMLEPTDLSASDEAATRASRIGASLWYFKNYPAGEIPRWVGTIAPDVADLHKAVLTPGADVTGPLAKFHKDMITTCAELDGTTTATTADAGQSGLHGLHDAYEVGRLLAVVVLTGSRSASQQDFTAAVSIEPGGPDNAAFRAYALLGGLRDCFPAAAAYSVARHLEDWSTWVNKQDEAQQFIDNPPPRYDEGSNWTLGMPAIHTQGRVWRAMLSGDALPRNYVVATSFTDAANRLLVDWATGATAVARGFARTAMARFLFIVAGILLAIFVGAAAFALLGHDVSSGTKGGVTVATIVAALATGAGVFHVSRTQVTTALTKVWDLVEPPMLEAELIEAIAMSTRRLPSDTVGGASPPQNTTIRKRLYRARRGSLMRRAPKVAVGDPAQQAGDEHGAHAV